MVEERSRRKEERGRARSATCHSSSVSPKIRFVRSEHVNDSLMQALIHLPKASARRSGARSTFVALFLGVVCTVASQGCTSKAVGIGACRDVENARCEASVPCGRVEVDGVEECKRFYYDQCLHGIQGPETPTNEELDQCVDMINEAGQEALEALLREELAETDEEKQAAQEDRLKACLVVGLPWRTENCAFILPEPEAMAGATSSDQ